MKFYKTSYKSFLRSLALLALCSVTAAACQHQHQLTWPTDQQLPCFSMPKPQHAILRATPQTQIWRPTQELPNALQQRLANFAQGRIGTQAAQLRLVNMTAPRIHTLLIAAGFRHQRVPLVVNPTAEPKQYWLQDGSHTTHPETAATVVAMDIYDHPDGSIVRVKPWGVPDRHGKTPRPQPHTSKAVAFDATQHCMLWWFACHIDTSWENEAFKVSDLGIPLPKSPTAEQGLLLDPQAAPTVQNAWKDWVMSQAHLDLPVSWQHCQPAP